MRMVARWMPQDSNGKTEITMKLLKYVPFAAAVLCVSPVAADEWVNGSDEAAVQAVLESSFTARNEAQLDRLEQSFMQKACSKAEMTGEALSDESVQQIQTEAIK